MNNFERQIPSENTSVPLRKKCKLHKSAERKTMRVKGLPFLNTKGVEIPARTTGPDCRYVIYFEHKTYTTLLRHLFFFRCNRLKKCFQTISDDEKRIIISQFNSLRSKNLQDSHLAGNNVLMFIIFYPNSKYCL